MSETDCVLLDIVVIHGIHILEFHEFRKPEQHPLISRNRIDGFGRNVNADVNLRISLRCHDECTEL